MSNYSNDSDLGFWAGVLLVIVAVVSLFVVIFNVADEQIVQQINNNCYFIENHENHFGADVTTKATYCKVPDSTFQSSAYDGRQ